MGQRERDICVGVTAVKIEQQFERAFGAICPQTATLYRISSYFIGLDAEMTATKHIGILAHSFEGAGLCYREICLDGVRRLGPHRHPEVTMTGIAMHFMMHAYERGDYDAVRRLFEEDIRKLAAAGADFFICPDNTAHIALERPGESFAIPCLHIGEVVAEQALREGRRKIGILGTDFTMTGPVYPGALGRRGIDWAIPGEEDRKRIHAVIFDELCLGIFEDSSRGDYVEIIERLAGEGCDAVALVCTEIPLLITAEASPLPILDSTRLLARAAVDVALGERPMPGWRGGKI
jgi:aspartate racemase